VNDNGTANLTCVKTFAISKNQLIVFSSVFAITWIIAAFLWYQAEIDKQVLFALNFTNFTEFAKPLFSAVSGSGMQAILFIYIIYQALTFRIEEWKTERSIFFLILLSFALIGICGDILKEIFDRARPFIEYAGQYQSLSNADSPSFPSGHATKSIALVLPLLFYSSFKHRGQTAVKILLSIIAGSVCLSRIALGAHYLSDILAGIGLVFGVLPLVLFPVNKTLRKISPERFNKASQKWILIYIVLFVVLFFM
jgi:membrane-associated phospholipid phosphatase